MIRFSFVALVLVACADTPAATTSCPRSIADYCATSSLPCPLTWSAAQDPASWGGCANRSADRDPLLLATCGNVLVAEMWGIDASTNYYYDARTGALLTITGHVEPRPTETCVAGVPQPARCDDPAPRSLCP